MIVHILLFVEGINILLQTLFKTRCQLCLEDLGHLPLLLFPNSRFALTGIDVATLGYVTAMTSQ